MIEQDPTRIEIDTDPTTHFMHGTTAHKLIPFSVPYISHIQDNLYLGGCTNGLILPTNIRHLISLYPWEWETAYVIKDDKRCTKVETE